MSVSRQTNGNILSGDIYLDHPTRQLLDENFLTITYWISPYNTPEPGTPRFWSILCLPHRSFCPFRCQKPTCDLHRTCALSGAGCHVSRCFTRFALSHGVYFTLQSQPVKCYLMPSQKIQETEAAARSQSSARTCGMITPIFAV